MKNLKNYLLIIFSIVLVAIGAYYMGQKSQLFQKKEKETADVMLEKISKVFKMVAVEGEVSEIYDYKAYQYWDIALLRKKALVRVKANVSIGYDLEGVDFVIDDSNKTITFNNFPEPEILYVEHDLDYYDIQESVFNEFSAEELSKINQRAKEYAVNLIEKGPLFDKAIEQKQEIFNLLKDMWEQSGWTLIIDQQIIKG
jgi:hypothetical protein